MADWTELPIDILGLVVQRFELVEDYHRFRAVCKQWRSPTPIEKEKPKFSLKFPSLMVGEPNREQKELEARRKFYSQLTSQMYEINLPEAAGKICMGVCPGWILTLGRDDFRMDLLSPLTKRRFDLPSMLHFKDQYEYDEDFKPEDIVNVFVKKVVASTSPGQEDCVVLAIHGEVRKLAFARPGDELWTNIDVSTKVFDDAVYYKGKFYVVDRHGVVFFCDLHHKDGPTTTIAAPQLFYPPQGYDGYQKYLVESCDDLYLLSRERGGFLFGLESPSEEDKSMRRRYFTSKFNVFMLVRDDSSKYLCRWEKVDNLGNRAFFLGRNRSISVSSSDCVRENCIYFCDDELELWLEQPSGGGHDTGIFDVKTGDIEWHYVSYQFQFRSTISPPFWYFN